MDIKIGFTGTREGMTDTQGIQLAKLLIDLKGKEFHHGDCVGSDEKAHKMALAAGYEVHIHPPKNKFYRAYCKIGISHPKEPYLTRNKNIVKATDILIATPETKEEKLRSGTWYTIRYAKKLEKRVHILYP